MKRILLYLFFGLFSLVTIYETIEVFFSDHHSCYSDMESAEKGSEENKKKEKEGKSEFEEEFLLFEFSLLCISDCRYMTLYQENFHSSTNYRKAIYSPPEHGPAFL